MINTPCIPGEPQAFAHPPSGWVSFGRLFFFFWFFSGLAPSLLWLSGVAGIAGFRDALYTSCLWPIPALLFPGRTRPIAAVMGLVLWAASLVNLVYFGIYGQEFSQSVIFIMLETDIPEAREYFIQYFNGYLALGLLLYSVAAFWLWRRLFPVRLPRVFRWGLCGFLFYASLGYPLWQYGGWSNKTLTRLSSAVPWQLAAGYVQYTRQIENVRKLLDANQALPPMAHFEDTSGETPRTLVMVIGESTSRLHMGLYGYPRPTTPRLEDLREAGGLTVFADVVASRPYTTETLEMALSFADPEHPERFLTQPSLVNLMRQAGYKTFWITNQQTMTKRNTPLTFLSQQADEAHYLNNNRTTNAVSHDEVVFAPFEKALRDAAPKKFIVVHLMGTHMSYKYRYPNSFRKFRDGGNLAPVFSSSQIDVINTYDNAVLYNDFVVAGLIQRFANQHGFLLYFSDHGEDVYDTPPHQFLGRKEYAPTRVMFAIPFLLWTSSSWQAEHPRDFSAVAARPYSTERLIHLWSDLAGLRYDGFRPEDSLVNPAFQPRPRRIGNPADKASMADFDQLPQ